MKRINLKLILSACLLMLASCDEPETIVTNIVRPDGSVLRKIEMRSSKNKFDGTVMQVPIDNTWKITDSCEIGVKGDTTWVRRAWKEFRSVEDINAGYVNDTTANASFPRHAAFSRKFRWFNTEYRFSEIVECRIKSGSSLRNFLNEEELRYFCSPESFKYSKLNSADSLKYKALADTIDKKTTDWALQNVVDVWINEFVRMTKGRSGPAISADSLKANEKRIIELIKHNEFDFDSVWANGSLKSQFIGEQDAIKFKAEADSSMTLALSLTFPDFKNYSVRIVMPGKLTGTNGYIDSTMLLLWPVNSDLFLADQYEMWAESKTPNIWAWIVSGLFIVFVASGLIIRKKSRREAGLKP